jgi:L-alanine-DL-glutamate epimerase-like enolase superfamily enzyme
MMVNYHAAFAQGGKLVEYPMLPFPLGDELLRYCLALEDGHLLCPQRPGLGIEITESAEQRYPYDP